MVRRIYKIEKYTKYEVSEFVRHFLTIRLGKTSAMKEIYSSFKYYVEKEKVDTLVFKNAN